MIFDDDEPDVCPLYKRLLCSLPSTYVQFSSSRREVEAAPPAAPKRAAAFSMFDEDFLFNDDDNDVGIFDSEDSDLSEDE